MVTNSATKHHAKVSLVSISYARTHTHTHAPTQIKGTLHQIFFICGKIEGIVITDNNRAKQAADPSFRFLNNASSIFFIIDEEILLVLYSNYI